MKTLNDHVMKYLETIGKDPEELREARVISAPTRPEDRMAWELELVFGNEWVTYTRVARFLMNGKGMQYKSITQKTRLWVPLGEVPEDGEFYIEAKGPYTKISLNDDQVYGMPDFHSESQDVMLSPNHLVECAFYYVKGVGAVAGEKVFAQETDLIDKFGPAILADLVGGCKFDFWDVCRELSGGNGKGQ